MFTEYIIYYIYLPLLFYTYLKVEYVGLDHSICELTACRMTYQSC